MVVTDQKREFLAESKLVGDVIWVYVKMGHTPRMAVLELDWLVVWKINFMIFPSYGGYEIPIRLGISSSQLTISYFSEELVETTNQN